MEGLVKSIVKVICILAFVAVLLFVGNVMVIASHIQNATNVYCAYAFYAALLVLLIIFVVIPIVKLLRMPSIMELSKVEDGDTVEKVQKIALNLAANYPATNEEEEKEGQTFAETVKGLGLTAKNELMQCVNNEIEKRFNNIDSKIKKYGKHVFIMTAISQNSRLDTVSVLILNFRMINDLIKSTGFRPNNFQMLKIYWRVMVTGAFAYATSEVVDMADESILSELSSNIGESIGSALFGKFLGIFAKSLADGAVNGLFTLRLGYVTKRYLQEGFDKLEDNAKENERTKNIYKDSLFEAWKSIKDIKMAS